MSDDIEIFFAKMPVLFYRNTDELTEKPKPRPRLVSASGGVVSIKKSRLPRKEEFRLSPREIKLSQMVAAKLVTNNLSDCPGLAFAIGLEADRLHSEGQHLESAAKRQSFVKSVIDEIGARTKQRDSMTIYTDRAVNRILQRSAAEEAQDGQNADEAHITPAPNAWTQDTPPEPRPALVCDEPDSSSSESECSFRIVRFVSDDRE